MNGIAVATIEKDGLIFNAAGDYACRRITSQNVRRFGYDTLGDLLESQPDAITIASDLRQSYYENALLGASSPRTHSATIKECEAAECTRTFKMIPLSRRFCSKKCSRISQPPRTQSEDTKRAISASVKRDHAANPRRAEPTRQEYEKIPIKCGRCGTSKSYLARKMPCPVCRERRISKAYYPYPESPYKPRRGLYGPFTRPCASCGCRVTPISRSYCTRCLDRPGVYRSRCAFQFNVYDWTEEFDIAMINQHGWYRPSHSRKGANLGGVSRDHLFSVADGASTR